ncbi:MAG: epoxyqueuosine reductase [Clostridia bacterium]|nr:epoxyqueuosine reductase [Clostridia bacterium]
MQDVSRLIRGCIGVPFGFCSFSAVADHLLDCRAKERLPKHAKTVICFAFPYKVKDEAPKNISRYAAVPDYHGICTEKLEKVASELKKAYPENEFSYFADNSPIPEVYASVMAGLGVRGKNGLLITEDYGSFVFLGEIVTDMEIACAESVKHCKDCGLCLSACPVGLDKSRCLSAVTQKKAPLTEEEEALIKKNGTVWGCDACQNVCPHNSAAKVTDILEFSSGYRDRYIPHEDINGRAYAWRGEKVILRNALLFDDIAQIVAAEAAADKD